MLKSLAPAVLIASALLAAPAAAEPVKLKLSFYTSDRASTYHACVKPFVEAVNAEGKGLIQIETYFSGALGKSQAQQPQLVLDGVADIAFVIPGMSPDRFADNDIIELPGLFQDLREATLTYTRLIAANALRGYEDFHVIGAYGSELESIHARAPITSLGSLKDKKIRVNNATEGTALGKLGMLPVLMPINLIPEAISSGTLDGAAVPLSMLFEFGIARVASYHYFLPTSPAPLALLMNRRTLDGLPAQAQSIIRKYSGEWAATRFIESREATELKVMEQLKSDPRRRFILPTQAELDTAHAAFKAVIEDVLAKSPRNREIMKAAKSELAKLRRLE
jgi:TRAP-type C4-dicarboxylate transport system substrate-binding protein